MEDQPPHAAETEAGSATFDGRQLAADLLNESAPTHTSPEVEPTIPLSVFLPDISSAHPVRGPYERLEPEHNGHFMRDVDTGIEYFMSRHDPELATTPDHPSLSDAITHPGTLVTREGFDLEQEWIQQRQRGEPIIEVGGPTPSGCPIVNELAAMPDWRITMNIARSPDLAQKRPLDVRADGTQLPLANESVGSVMMAAVGGNGQDKAELHAQLFAEYSRVLKPGGFVVDQYASLPETQRVLASGKFELEAIWVNNASRGDPDYPGEHIILSTVWRRRAEEPAPSAAEPVEAPTT